MAGQNGSPKKKLIRSGKNLACCRLELATTRRCGKNLIAQFSNMAAYTQVNHSDTKVSKSFLD